MNIKRFVAKNMQDALLEVKRTFGNDAVILSNKNVPDGIELVAAVDYDETAVQNAVAKQEAQAAATAKQVASDYPFGQTIDTKIDVTPEPQAQLQQQLQSQASVMNPLNLQAAAADQTMSDMNQQISALRELVEQQLSGFAWQRMQHQTPVQAAMFKRLRELGFTQKFCENVLQIIAKHETMDAAWQHIQQVLLHNLPVMQNDFFDCGGVIAFVGPSGVGKTTTIAKLAARFVLRYGAENLGLITTDSYRIAAQEQLSTYGKLLGVSVAAINNVEQLQEQLNALRDKRLILIDTAGMGQRDARLREQLQLIQSLDRRVYINLVIASTGQGELINQIIQAFSQIKLDHCVLTKLDETINLIPALENIINHQLPLAYVTDGQMVPEDIKPAHANDILQKAFELSKYHKAHNTKLDCFNFARSAVNAQQ